jgi:hypothetical protein
VPLGRGPASPWVRTARVRPPPADRYLLRLGDRCVPCRHCAGAGCGPPEPVVLLTADETRRPWVELPVVLTVSHAPSLAGQPVWSGMPLRRVRWRSPPEAAGVVWLTAAAARRPWVGLPATSRVHPWLGDRRIPSRRCAGGGSRPVCARSRVDCGRGPTPPAWSPGASRLSGSDSLFKLV